MTHRHDKILDVAERLIRARGYSGFSFRDIADEVGIKSASVHYHFPTKPDLAAAVAKRYRERCAQVLEAAEQQGTGRVNAWRALFHEALKQDGLMCLCGILAVDGASLPAEVAREARAFLQFGIASLDEARPGEGLRILSQLEGAMLIARSAGDPGVFAQATDDLGAI
ncbi:TetR/AcrR family transcriptional regulator [Yoonia sediminilitoris]|uniref:TetR family transcriptional regulator n=1 Tax=Yoonia sediminilitoris TaxID=1286148 RepID=A0A2T6KKE5_9RHOB|nr:TetR/AcrR family transcriptional regulator [Yoonia sediminilitoris]PUB16434.1 TetR family transcriptional regulator [Yoonia sediminilitoris]RCW96783.1 TetR family transcriptional regulator [Yoonia sediminilitoris]